MSEQAAVQRPTTAPAIRARTETRPTLTVGIFVSVWLCGLGSLGFVCLLWPSPFLLAGVLLVMSALMLAIRRSSADVLLWGICGRLGAIAESFGIASGAWSYALPLVAGVPVWLPLIWGIAAVFIKEI
ncbi:MAG: hypothetical protein ABI874_02355, partial [Chloroflexota bacterium]